MHSRSEIHFIHRTGWLRAAVLGANDGIVSTASLIMGVSVAGVDQAEIILAGVAGLVAGAMSMAAGEYVSVSSQADTEKADIEKEKQELKETPGAELDELTNIYIKRGLDHDLAREVAVKLTEHDALKTHLRDELGYAEHHEARPIQAALVSAATFIVGAAPPILLIFITPTQLIPRVTLVSSILLLALLGAVAAHTGGASKLKGVIRVVVWGTLAMGLTAAIGKLVGMSVH